MATGFKGISLTKSGRYDIRVLHNGCYARVTRKDITLEEAVKIQQQLKRNMEVRPSSFTSLEEIKAKRKESAHKSYLKRKENGAYSKEKTKETPVKNKKAMVRKPKGKNNIPVTELAEARNYKTPFVVAASIALVLLVYIATVRF